jgi:hemoglobin
MATGMPVPNPATPTPFTIAQRVRRFRNKLRGRPTDVVAPPTPMSAEPVSPQSPFQRIGGTASVRKAVEMLYVRLLADPDLAPYFKGVDLSELKRHMVLLLIKVLGGPEEYPGRDLDEAHRRLNITDAHYNLVVMYLNGVLTELGVPRDILDDVNGVLAAVKSDIVKGVD